MAFRRYRASLMRAHKVRQRRRQQLAKTGRRSQLEALERRDLMAGPQLIGIQPNNGSLLESGDIRDEAPVDLTFRFDENQTIDPVTLNGIRLTRSGKDGVFGNGNDQVITPGFIGLGERAHEVVMRFSQPLPDDVYRIDIFGAGAQVLRNVNGEPFNSGQNFNLQFELDLGAQVIAVVPQPVERVGGVLTQRKDQIVVYFNDDDLDASASNPAFYQLRFTNDTVTNTDDVVHVPTSVAYDPATDKAVLTFAGPIETLSGPGSYRLRIGTDETIPAAPTRITPSSDPGSSFGTSQNITSSFVTTTQSSVILSQLITPAESDGRIYPLEFPGAVREPGHRHIAMGLHYNQNVDEDNQTGIATQFYNFQSVYGSDPEGNILQNLITETQKQRVREAFELWGNHIGIQFIETASQGFTMATGDMRALHEFVPTGSGNKVGLSSSDVPLGGFASRTEGVAVLDNAEQWDDRFGRNYFQAAMHQIGRLLGIDTSYELPPLTVMGDEGELQPAGGRTNAGGEPILAFDNPTEPVFPGPHDVVHGQYLFRPESKDIDLYRFQVDAVGLFEAETLAERLSDSSLLDTLLTLYGQNADGTREVIARNDDYYSEDSFLRAILQPGTYFIGVSASGNNSYDPEVTDSGIGGKTQGRYDLRLNFRPNAVSSITDADNPTRPPTALDGDADGVPGGAYNFWFRAQTDADTIFVDKAAAAGGTGSRSAPFRTIPEAFGAAQPGDIVRIVGNGGADGNIHTVNDNLAYEIGFGALGNPLQDGQTMVVPKGVTVMVDEGTIFKMRRSRIGVGSSTLNVDRSQSAFQVLGTPLTNVIFTSYNDKVTGLDTNPFPATPQPGDWGGIIFRNDLDLAQQRVVWERLGIFLDYVNNADIRYGGGNVVIDGTPQVIDPIHMTRSRPTISHNLLRLSANAAISAEPNSFEETNFHAAQFQLSAPFTSDYERVGPDIDNNRLLNNSTNGLFVRIETLAGNQLQPMTVAGRWDDTSIVHVVSEILVIQGTPGGPLQEEVAPPTVVVTLTPQAGGTLPEDTYNYKLTFVDTDGNEGPASNATRDVTVGPGEGSVQLRNLPAASGRFVARRLYRLIPDGSFPPRYELVAQLNASDPNYLDNGTTAGGLLVDRPTLERARLDARLAIDPGTIVKLEGARIETGIGAQLIAEGVDGREIIFTSRLDDRYGGSGNFDTNNDGSASQPTLGGGDWGGIYLAPGSTASIDHSLITFGGGVNRVEGSFAGFAALEIHGAEARVTNSIFEANASGAGGQAPSHRFGRGFNEAATIFVRGAQPILVNNIIGNEDIVLPNRTIVRRNAGSAISINVNALSHEPLIDYGRSTGDVDLVEAFRDNQGPLIRLNRLTNNAINGMEVRGETMTTQGVWDDTDIVHVVTDTIYVPDFHTYGGLRLESNPTQSLVVKLFGANAGFTSTGRPLDIEDRIGGILQIVGQPGSPVVFTSLRDDSVGAGFRAGGDPQTDTNNDLDATEPAPADWRSIRIDQYSHDRNVEVIIEQEAPDVDPPGVNAIPDNAQALGELAPHEKAGDDNNRLGFEIHGFLNAPSDLDVYSFRADAGTEVWFDIDRTTHALDTIVELLDTAGQIIARSDNSFDETAGTQTLFADPNIPELDVNVLQKSPYEALRDGWTTNPRDAGMRVILPGTIGARSTFYVRVRSNGPDLSNPLGGLTAGMYQLQVRLNEIDEFPGSTVRFADVRYATNGIEVFGQAVHSPLLGEVTEQPASVDNNDINNAQPSGNVLNTDRGAMAISGDVSGLGDIDFYRFEINYDSIQDIGGFNNQLRHLSTIFDMDYADGFARADTRLAVFDANFNLILSGNSSNIADDRPGPLQGADVDDLSRGTIGPLDPFIGSIEMPEGVYYIAVSADSHWSRELEQFVTHFPSNPMLRLEPVDSIRRIAEDHIPNPATFGAQTHIATQDRPQIEKLFEPHSIVPFNLGDVVTFVSQEDNLGRARRTYNLRMVDPFTGRVETTVGLIDDANDDNGPYIGDIAMRHDGRLFTYTVEQAYFGNGTPWPNDEDSGNYLEIDTGTAAYTFIGDDGIETWMLGPDGELRARDQPAPPGIGVHFEAMTFFDDDHGYAVGYRGEDGLFDNGVTRRENILYKFNLNTGQAISNPSIDRGGCGSPGGCRYPGAGTNIRERGQIITRQDSVITVEATLPDGTIQIPDGFSFRVEFPGPFGITFFEQFEFDAGAEALINVDQATGNIVRDGHFFMLDEIPENDGSGGPGGAWYQFNTGSVIVVHDRDNDGFAGDEIVDGQRFTIEGANGNTITFEFEDTAPGDGVDFGNVQIPFSATTTPNQLVTEIVNRIDSVAILGVNASAISSLNLVSLQGDATVTGAVTRDQAITTTFTGSSVVPISTGQLRHIIRAESGANIVEGDTVTISNGQDSIVLEFDDAATTPPPTTTNTLITYTTADSADTIADKIVAAIVAHTPDLRLQPQNMGTGGASDPYNGFIQFNVGFRIEGDHGQAPLLRIPTAGQITDGRFFTVSLSASTDPADNPVTTRFEFDFGNGVSPDSVPVRLSPIDDTNAVALKMHNAINAFSEATAHVAGNELSVNGPGVTFSTDVPNITPLTLVTDVGMPPIPYGLLQAEETDTRDQVGTKIENQTRYAIPITNITARNVSPIRITSNEHGLISGQSVVITGVTTVSPASNNEEFQTANGTWTVDFIDANTFSLRGSAGAAFDSNVDNAFWFHTQASQEGDRINFLGSNTADFSGAPIFTDQGTRGGVDPLSEQLGFLADDTAANIASRMAEIIDRELRELGVDAVAMGNRITVSNGRITSQSLPILQIQSFGAGGQVTGIAFIGDDLYAVDDNGGLYVVPNGQWFSHDPPPDVPPISQFVANLGVNFSGLTAGPPHAEGGRYANMLFGITENGRLYAFDTAGNLQPVFVDGQTNIQMTDELGNPLGNVNGIAFSNVDYNLWHFTDRRRTDPGHGVVQTFNDSRVDAADEGSWSLYFGFESRMRNNANNAPDPGNRNNYNFPGGVHGSVESNLFSLEGYAPEDKPSLYFSYFLDTENQTYDPFTNPINWMRDAFRVYIADDNGQWQLLGTNNSFRHELAADEYDLHLVPSPFGPDQREPVGASFVVQPQLLGNEVPNRRGVQELYDNTDNWRQARVDLGAYAGRPNLKLRFEFSTAGEMGLGAPLNTGAELRAIDGSKLRDGDTVRLSNPARTFEIDMGYTLVTRNGDAINNGDSFRVDGRTFQYWDGTGSPPTGNVIVYNRQQSAEEIAVNTQIVMENAGIAVERREVDDLGNNFQSGNRLNLPNSNSASLLTGQPLFIEGQPGVSPGNVQIQIRSDLDRYEVAAVVRQALAGTYATGLVDAIKSHREVIYVVGRDVIDQGPFGLSDFLRGDTFGNIQAGGPPEITGRYPGALAGLDNDHEGVYIDDIIIGFAEHGEIATNAVADPSFTINPQLPENSVIRGEYQLEVRRGAQYGAYQPLSPLGVSPPLDLVRSFDTNDRLVHQVTFVAPSADQVHDGQTFWISDGVDKVIFEYEDADQLDGVTSGHIPVIFDATVADGLGHFTPQPAWVVARTIRDAINSASAQDVIEIQAAIDDGEVSGVHPVTRRNTTSNRVNLFGNASGNVVPTFNFGDIIVDAHGLDEVANWPQIISVGPSGGFFFNESLYALPGTFTLHQHSYMGDSNRRRDQGHILIHSNTISNSSGFGIVADTGQRNRDDLVPLAGDLPHPGPVRNLAVINNERLAPGVTIENNLIFGGGQGGIHYSGDPNAGTDQLAPVPYGRILNNTLYGQRSGDVGILVDENASPTLLNNIVANFDVGIQVDSTSQGTVTGGSLYSDNNTHTVGISPGAFAIDLDAIEALTGEEEPLFVDPANRNFYLEANSLAIDSSIDSLEERTSLASVRSPLGIPPSPILAPDRDVTGQLRVDDPSVSTPAGQGQNVFKDRGALDRADFIGPTALLIRPRDNDADNNDLNRDATVVELPASTVLSNFEIQLVDGLEPAEPSDGIGVDDTSVDAIPIPVTLTRDGVLLEEGIDYTFSYNATSDTIRLTPIAGIWQPNRVYVITLNNSDSFVVTPRDGRDIADSDRFNITDADGNVVTFEFESGFRLQVPQTFTLQVPAAGGGVGGIADGETFQVGNGQQLVRFEFDSNNNTTPGNTRVPFTSQSTAAEMADAIVAALQAAGLGLTPRHLGNGEIHLGSNALHTVDTSQSSLVLVGVAQGVADGDQFSIDDGTKVVTFEFDSDGNSQATNEVITFTAADTHEEIADDVATAIDNADVDLDPTHLGDGDIFVGGTQGHQIDTTRSALTLTGQPGVSPPFGIQIPARAGQPLGIADGQTFSIGDGVNPPVRFEFDSNGVTTAPNTPIQFNGSMTVQQLAANIVSAINAAGVGLTAEHVGFGIIHLNGSNTNHTLNVGTTPLEQLGAPGEPGAVPVFFTPRASFDATQVSVALIEAIDEQGLVGVTARPGGGSLVVIEGARDVTDTFNVFEDLVFIRAIEDKAGNDLKPNQVSGETKFTILLGSVGRDFGDAPQPLGAAYPTTSGNNGAIHVLNGGMFLGSAVDSELDGQPTVGATGDDTNGVDDEDGVTGLTDLNPFVVRNITVTASAAGLLDAWVDYNRDGDWDDAGEQIFANRQLAAGANQLTVSTPLGAVVGQTYARFRFSSSGGLTPYGLAANGEVEDYAVDIVAGAPPNAVDDAYTTTEDAALLRTSPGVLANDSDPDGDPIRVIDFDDTSARGAAVGILPSGGFVYDPSTSAELQALAPGESLTDTFTYTITDDQTGTDTATVTVTVTGINDGPTAVNDSYTVTEGATLNVTSTNSVKNNDFDPEGDSFNLVLVSGPANASAFTFNSDGTFIYTHNGGETTTDSFTYRGNDGSLDGNVATVTINITPANDAPVANDDTYAVNEGGTLTVNTTALGVLGNDSDADGDTLIATVVDGPTRGTLTLNTNGTLTYTHNGSETTSDSFTYRASDPSNGNDIATVTINVTPVNDPPVANDDTYATVQGGTLTVTPRSNGVLGNDTDAEGATLTATVVQNVSNGTLTFNSDGTFTYVHNGGATTSDSFTYQASDGQGGTDLATVTINLSQAPVANNDSYTVSEGGTLNITSTSAGVLGNDTDPDGDPLTATLVTGPARGTLTLNANGTFTYTHNGSELATDSFVYRADDGSGGTDTATATINITPVNDVPNAVDDTFQVPRNQAVIIAAPGVLANDTDAEGSQLQVTGVVNAPTHGTLTLNPNGSFTYRHNGDAATTDTFTYRITDGQQTDTATVTMLIFIPPWQNPVDNLDTDANGIRSPLDALLVINDINLNGIRQLPPPTPGNSPPPYIDINGNNSIEPSDVLEIINYLNSLTPTGEGELVQGAEGEATEAPASSNVSEASSFELLAAAQFGRLDSGYLGDDNDFVRYEPAASPLVTIPNGDGLWADQDRSAYATAEAEDFSSTLLDDVLADIVGEVDQARSRSIEDDAFEGLW